MQNQALFEATTHVFHEFTQLQIDVLHTILAAPNKSASAGQLKTMLGLSAVILVNAAIGKAGQKVFKKLGRHPEGLSEGNFEWWNVLATGQEKKTIGFVWTLRPEVVGALIQCGLTEKTQPLAEEIQTTTPLKEGTYSKVLVNVYERNPVARAKCLAFYGYRCVACGIDFEEQYGPLAKGFIHVHHLRQISDIGEEYEVDPIQDLRPVCPNCHAVIHMTPSPYSIDQIKGFLELGKLNA